MPTARTDEQEALVNLREPKPDAPVCAFFLSGDRADARYAASFYQATVCAAVIRRR